MKPTSKTEALALVRKARDEWRSLVKKRHAHAPICKAWAESGELALPVGVGLAATLLEAVEFLAETERTESPEGAPLRQDVLAALLLFRELFAAAGPACRALASDAEKKAAQRVGMVDDLLARYDARAEAAAGVAFARATKLVAEGPLQ